MFPESKAPPRAVTVWGTSSRFTTVIGAPAGTVRVSGMNLKFSITILAAPAVGVAVLPAGGVSTSSACQHCGRG